MDDFDTALESFATWMSREEDVELSYAEQDFQAPILTPAWPLIELLLVVEGVLVLRVGDSQVLKVRAGEAALVNAHFGNQGHNTGEFSIYNILSVHVGLSPRLLEWEIAPRAFVRPVDDWQKLSQLMKEVRSTFYSPAQRLSRIALKTSFLQVLLLLSKESATTGSMPFPSGGPPRLRASLELLMNRHGDPSLTMNELAMASNLSLNHFGRLFKRHFGFSPLSYLAQYRLNRAKGLLDRTDMTMKEIAFHTGFQDPLYFSRQFHKATGESPSKFRSRAQGSRR